MKIKKLYLKNIRSYENQTINFPDGSLLLSGNIGSGKSSILLAIEYALFGLQPGQKGSALLRNSSDLGEVSLELEIDGIPILIERKLKRSSKGVGNEYASITIDGKKEESSVTEVKTRILELLQYPKEFIKKTNLLYRYTVFTPQEQMKQIILEDSETRLNIIRHIFGIDKYKNIRENLSLLLNFIKEKSKLLQGEIKSLDEDIKILEEKKVSILSLNNKISSADKTFREKSSVLNKFSSEIEELEKKIAEKQNLEKEVEKTLLMYNIKMESLSSLKRECIGIEKSLAEQKDIYNESEFLEIEKNLISVSKNLESANSSYITIISSLNSLEKEVKEKTEKKEKIFKIQICPTCLQDVPEVHKHNILNESENYLSSARNKISSLQNEKILIEELIKSLKQNQSSLSERKISLEILKSKEEYREKSRERLEAMEKNRTTLESDLEFLQKHINSLKEEILKFSVFDSQLKKSRLLQKEALQDERNAEIYGAELRKELEMTHREISHLQNSINVKNISKQNLSNLLELEAWLSGKFHTLIEFTERNILINLRIEFSEVFSKWFHMLVPEENFQVRLDESFSPILIHKETEMDYSFLSGGERTAVALAYRLALNQTINSMLSRIKTRELVILDEPTEGFSETQLDRMRNIFSELNVAQLIIVSHEQKMEGFVENIIKISKEDDLSSVSKMNLSKSFEPKEAEKA